MHHRSVPLIVGLLPLVLVCLLIVVGYLYMKHRGYYQGDRNSVVVRCRQGHLFTTIWIPFVSFKAIRLGPVRYQNCPIGNHWTFVDIVNVAGLTNEERQFAANHHDSLIP